MKLWQSVGVQWKTDAVENPNREHTSESVSDLAVASQHQSVRAYFFRTSLIRAETDESGENDKDEAITNGTARKAPKLRF